MINGSGETFGFFPLNPNSNPTIVPLSCSATTPAGGSSHASDFEFSYCKSIARKD
jgi:hypothetical protein